MARVVRTASVLHPVVWILRGAHTPRVPRRCPRCDVTRDFVSSDRFRLNAQKRRVDVFLVYRCPSCDFTWNATVGERATPEDIGAVRYPLYQENDPATAWRCAFAVPGADLAAVPVVVERPPLVLPARVSVVRADPVRVRADRLLATELGRSRSTINRALAAGDLAVDGETLIILE
jgi:hypothetical protein